MSKSANFIGQPIFSQLLKYLPRNEINKIATEHRSDHYTKRFKTYDHLVSMLYSSFHNCRSLREVVTGMMACYGKIYHLGLTDYPKRSTLSDANGRRDSQVFEAIYKMLFTKYRSVLSDSPKLSLMDRRLFLVDSTTLTLFQEILKAAGKNPANGKRKGGIKAHVLVRADEDVPCLVNMSSSASRDTIFMKNIHLPKNAILVFDRGYNSYSEYNRLSEQGINWVTRKNNKSAIEVTATNPVDEQQAINGVLKDEHIIMGNTHNKKQIRVQARRVTYRDKETQRTFEFITNNRSMKPSTIAQLYERRWQIEILFKRLKQNNQLTYFLGDNENAIRIQIWCAMIADLITKIVQKKIKRPWSFANLSSMIRIHLMTYTSLLQFLENPEKQRFGQQNTNQLELFLSG